MPVVHALRGPLSLPALSQALAALAARHEVLRTTFSPHGGQLVSTDDRAAASRSSTPGGGRSAPDRRPRQARGRAALRPQAARRRGAPCCCAPCCCTKAGAPSTCLLLTFHHTIIDGASVCVVLAELSGLYAAALAGEAAALPPLASSSTPTSRPGSGRASTASGWRALLAWWRERLSGAPARLELPTDRPRPAVASPAGRRLRARARSGARRRPRGARPAARRHSLHGARRRVPGVPRRLSGQSEVVIGTPVAGRDRPEIAGLVGLFVNTLALRADLSDEPSFAALLVRARQATLAAFAHADLSLEKLVEALAPARSLDRTPLFQVMLGGAVARASRSSTPASRPRGCPRSRRARSSTSC